MIYLSEVRTTVPNKRNPPFLFGNLSLTSNLRDALSLLLGLSASYLQNVHATTGESKRKGRLLALDANVCTNMYETNTFESADGATAVRT